MNWWENTGWKEYRNKEWGFGISYPSLLRLYEDRGSSLFLSNNAGAKNSGAVIVGFDSNMEKSTTLEKLTEIKLVRKVRKSDTITSVKKNNVSFDTLEGREIITNRPSPIYKSF